jgi:uncharacterized membrane protein YqgA involved in biofilm formation
MFGTIVNAAAIIIGGLLGTVLGHRFPDKMKTTVIQGLGLTVLLVGMQMAIQSKNLLMVIFSIVIGGIIGEWIDIEEALHRVGRWIESKFKGGDGNIAAAFVRTSLIYCVGAMAITGAIQDGLSHDPSTLIAKGMIDGFSAIAFSATMGIGVVLSAIPVFLYQGLLTIAANWVEFFMTGPIVLEMTATGGLLIMGIGLNIMEITKIKVGNLLPAIFVAVILTYFFG